MSTQGSNFLCRTVYDSGGVTITVTTLRGVTQHSVVAPVTVVVAHAGVEVGRAQNPRLQLAPRRRLPDDLAWAGRPLLDLIAIAREEAYDAAPCDAEDLHLELMAVTVWLRRHIKATGGVPLRTT